MNKRRLIAAVASLLAVSALTLGSILASAPARAAPQPSKAAPLPISASVTETAKVVLPETSINAPGFFSYVNQPTAGTVIAWAGTDATHHLNVMTSADGLHYSNKITLGETSIRRPAVARMPKAAGGAVILAWTGVDANRSLNVLFDVYGSRQKLTLADNSFTSPALAIFNGNLLLAWTGTDASHSLNVRQIFLAPLRAGPTTILSGVGSNAWPNLTVKGKDSVFNSNSNVVLGWQNAGGIPNVLQLAESRDGSHFSTLYGMNGLIETSAFGPSYLWFPTEGGPENWIAWTGTDVASHLHVWWSSKYPQWNGSKTILPETAFGGPMLGFDQGLLIAWTGTDAAHHLNVARLSGF